MSLLLLLRSSSTGSVTGSLAATVAAVTADIDGTVVNPTVTGAINATLDNILGDFDGTVTNPGVTGALHATLDNVTADIDGTYQSLSTGALAATLAPVTADIDGTYKSLSTGALAATLAAVTADLNGTVDNPVPDPGFSVPYGTPASTQITDQHGDPHSMWMISAWGMYTLGSDADITTAVETIAALGAPGFTVWMCGGLDGLSGWPGFADGRGRNFFAGTAFQTALGTGWLTTDWIVDEALRCGLYVNLSLNASPSDAGPEINAASNGQMTTFGAAVATRYIGYEHINWHIMFDDNPGSGTSTPASTRGQRIKAFFQGINSVEDGVIERFRWIEGSRTDSNDNSGWIGDVDMRLGVNGYYEYTTSSVTTIRASVAENTGVPTGNPEPPYDASTNTGSDALSLRRSITAQLVEVGAGYYQSGFEWEWPFDETRQFNGEPSVDWRDLPTHDHAVQQARIYATLKSYVEDTTYAHATVLNSGGSSGATTAAQGKSDSCVLVGVFTTGTINVDTTVIAGASNVRIRWYDATAGTFTSVATSEAQSASRSITHPGNNSAGASDWILIVDEPPATFTGALAATLAGVTANLVGTSAAPSFTGALAATLADVTADFDGTRTVPVFTGSLAGIVADVTSDLDGTTTAPTFTGALSATLADVTANLDGTATPPPIDGALAGIVDDVVAHLVGSVSEPGVITGQLNAVVVDVIATFAGTSTPPAITGLIEAQLADIVADFVGTFTPPPVEGVLVGILDDVTSHIVGTVLAPGETATVGLVGTVRAGVGLSGTRVRSGS